MRLLGLTLPPIYLHLRHCTFAPHQQKRIGKDTVGINTKNVIYVTNAKILIKYPILLQYPFI